MKLTPFYFGIGSVQRHTFQYANKISDAGRIESVVIRVYLWFLYSVTWMCIQTLYVKPPELQKHFKKIPRFVKIFSVSLASGAELSIKTGKRGK